MTRYLIKNANIVNEGEIFKGHILIQNKSIKQIFRDSIPTDLDDSITIIDAEGKYLLPGIIDDQVHFREPGLTHKADIYHESKAAVAGGVTSFMEMPNTVPNAITYDILEEKYEIGAKNSFANFSFYMGATNDNIEEIKKINPKNVCGTKVFMGSSTGNMLVDDIESLNKIFSECPTLIAVHCEDEQTIVENTEAYKKKYGEDIPISAHPEIRSDIACYKSSSLAVELAKKHGTRLHVLHLTSAKEMELFEKGDIDKKKITAEVCVHHLWFDSDDYETKGTHIKWNPAVKTKKDKKALLKALLNDKIDLIATDHAPHTLEEKDNKYLSAPSGGPLVQFSLLVMLELYKKKKITLEQIVNKMCHAPAKGFNINKRGFIKEGYYADLTLVDLNKRWTLKREDVLSKCKWSPFEGQRFKSKVTHTFVNGNLVYDNGVINEKVRGERLFFKEV